MNPDAQTGVALISISRHSLAALLALSGAGVLFVEAVLATFLSERHHAATA